MKEEVSNGVSGAMLREAYKQGYKKGILVGGLIASLIIGGGLALTAILLCLL